MARDQCQTADFFLRLPCFPVTLCRLFHFSDACVSLSPSAMQLLGEAPDKTKNLPLCKACVQCWENVPGKTQYPCPADGTHIAVPSDELWYVNKSEELPQRFDPALYSSPRTSRAHSSLAPLPLLAGHFSRSAPAFSKTCQLAVVRQQVNSRGIICEVHK